MFCLPSLCILRVGWAPVAAICLLTSAPPQTSDLRRFLSSNNAISGSTLLQQDKKRVNTPSMSVRSVFGGRVNPATVSSLISSAPLHQSSSQMASKQLARLHSTAVRPSQRAVPRMAFLPQVRSSQSSLGGLAGRRAQSTSAANQDTAKLDWNSFFKLRASRRRYSLASSIVTSLVSTAVGVQFLSTQDLESLGAQVMGLDPFVVLGLATAACGAVGWLAGPIVGNGTWGLVYRRFKPSFASVSTQPARSLPDR